MFLQKPARREWINSSWLQLGAAIAESEIDADVFNCWNDIIVNRNWHHIISLITGEIWMLQQTSLFELYNINLVCCSFVINHFFPVKFLMHLTKHKVIQAEMQQ